MALQEIGIQFADLGDIFKVKEIKGKNIFSTGVAVTAADRTGRLALVTERYLDPSRQYITADDLNENGLYIDKYEDISIPLVSKHDGLVVASFRMIQASENLGLPMQNSKEIIISAEWQNKVDEAPFELSQFAKALSHKKYPQPSIAVIKAYMAIADQLGIKEAIAVIDDGVVATLNGPYSGFDLPKIGPSVYYLGSSSTPVFINIDNVRINARNNGHPELADFLEGKKNVPGFEWYVGP